ncbi:hypothetical protein L4X63_23085 [Geomonas sp. Red32]|uniref:hypothetical protein n=1 Tax=Geomonas sp. Red32 TaxID=2912856 RepID=UPI00202CD5F7|nr:hypothetical protein [Geomonas sp. Red32]MCM0084467.1 hypothetical protein [Geomonas sp. Red32]
MPRTQFFDSLKRNLDLIDPKFDNEALRHDLIIHPILTSPDGLGWYNPEVIPQLNTAIYKELKESYVWKGAQPVRRRPDLVIVPLGMNNPVAIVEEKKRQIDISALKRHVGQVTEYQCLHNAVWGLLSDGEKWVLKKNNQIFHTFANLTELEKNFDDFKNCIGRVAIMSRLVEYNTSDLVIVAPARQDIFLCSLDIYSCSSMSLSTFFSNSPAAATDLMIFLGKANEDIAAHGLDTLKVIDCEQLWKYLMLHTIALPIRKVALYKAGLELDKLFKTTSFRDPEIYVDEWRKFQHDMSVLSKQIRSGAVSADDIIDVALKHDTVVVADDLPENIRTKIKNHALFGNLPNSIKTQF